MVSMFGRVISERERCGRIRAVTVLGRLLWVLCLVASQGCAQLGGSRSTMARSSRAPLLVNPPPVGSEGASRSPGHQTVTTVRGHALPGPHSVQPVSEPVSPPPAEPEFLPPQTPDLPRGNGASLGSFFSEVPGGYWIVSSRQARLPPGDIDSSRDLTYLYRTPQSMRAFPREVFLSTLRANRPTCITIHGSYNYWTDVLSESVHSLRWINQASQGREIQFVYFSWPADGYAHLVFPLELVAMGRRASRHSLYLANLLGQFPEEQPVCLVGHSHGARCSVATLHALGGGALEDGSRLVPGSGVPRRMNAVLLAAAVDHDWLNPGEKYGAALPVTERMLVMQNERDSWLNAYPLKDLMGNRQALGRGGFQEADTIRMSDQIGKISVLDASPFAGRSHDFRAFHSSMELAAAIAPFVLFDPEAKQRSEERGTSSQPSLQPAVAAPTISHESTAHEGTKTSQTSSARHSHRPPVPGGAATARRVGGVPQRASTPRHPARDTTSNPLRLPR
jgi:hypothetical protein